MAKRVKIQDFHKIAENHGGRCLSETYTNSRTKLTFQCAKDHPPWKTIPRNVAVLGTWCPTCAGHTKKSISDMHKLASGKGGKCLSEKYVNSQTSLCWQCERHHPPFEATFSSIKHSGQWCPVCTGNLPKTIQDMQRMAVEKGGKCLSQEYKGARIHLTWQCAKGHDAWEAKPYNIKTGYWCPTCAKRPIVSITDMQKIAADRNGKCLSKKYLNAHSKLEWQCAEGHKPWKASPNKVKRGNWCPLCTTSYPEELCRTTFEQLFGKEFVTCRPDWLRGAKGFNLELDGFCEAYNIAFEYQGEQHFQTVSFGGGTKSDLESQIIRDAEKFEGCKRNGITLLIITHEDDLAALPQLIKQRSNELGRNLSEIDFTKIIDFNKVYEHETKIAKMHRIAAERGGKCLSEKYINTNLKLEWQCAEGHTWQAAPNSVQDKPFAKRKKGSWCRICVGLARLSINDMHKIATERGGKCLSKKYINAHSKLEWQCAEGHQWEAVARSVRYGAWCRKCSRKKGSAAKSQQSLDF